MKKHWLGFMAAVVFSMGAISVMPSFVDAEGAADVELTEEQQLEMAELQKTTLEQKKQIINKYVEYGVFTKEKGEKVISHLDKYYDKLEKNHFIPTCDWSKAHRKENDDQNDN